MGHFDIALVLKNTRRIGASAEKSRAPDRPFSDGRAESRLVRAFLFNWASCAKARPDPHQFGHPARHPNPRCGLHPGYRPDIAEAHAPHGPAPVSRLRRPRRSMISGSQPCALTNSVLAAYRWRLSLRDTACICARCRRGTCHYGLCHGTATQAASPRPPEAP